MFPIPGTGWNNTYAMGTHKAHIQEPGWWRTWQVRVLCGVESPADLLQVNCPWMSDFRGTSGEIRAGCVDGCVGNCVGSYVALDHWQRGAGGHAGKGVIMVHGHLYCKINIEDTLQEEALFSFLCSK